MEKNEMLKVGVAKAELLFPKDFFPIENLKYIHDQLHVRVMYLQANQSFIFVSFELTSLRSYLIENLKNLIHQITGVAKENIWICVTHTFSAPHSRSLETLAKSEQSVKDKNEEFCHILYEATQKATLQAIEKKHNVNVGFGHGYCHVNVNRDISTKDGWWLGANDLGISDKTIPIIKFENESHQVSAILYSYDVQSSVMEGSLLEEGVSAVTSDLTGVTSQYIEEQYGNDCVAMYIVGAAGDQAPLFKAKHHVIDKNLVIHTQDIHENGFVLVQALGTKLGNQVVRACERIKTKPYLGQIQKIQTQVICPGQKIRDRSIIHPTHHYQFEKDEDRIVDIEMIQLGYIVLIAMQPELSSVTAMDIRKQSPFPLTMVLTMVNGGAKYMPDQTSYDRITYEAMNSKYTKGSAEILSEQIVKTLESIEEK